MAEEKDLTSPSLIGTSKITMQNKPLGWGWGGGGGEDQNYQKRSFTTENLRKKPRDTKQGGLEK